MNVFSRLRNSLWPSPSCDYQINGIDIRLGYTNLRGILDGKWTIRYESTLDILISMFSGINKCLQGRNIFVIDFGSSRYQNFVISLIRISAEFPAYNRSPTSMIRKDSESWETQICKLRSVRRAVTGICNGLPIQVTQEDSDLWTGLCLTHIHV